MIMACAAELHIQYKAAVMAASYPAPNLRFLVTLLYPGFDSTLANDYLQSREPQEAYQVVLKASLAALLGSLPLLSALHRTADIRNLFSYLPLDWQ